MARRIAGLVWILAALACTHAGAAVPNPAQSGFFRAANGEILNPEGEPVILRGVGLGGWLVPEGYMLHISAPDGGSPRSIRAQIEDLIGPTDADTFFQLYRENYVAEKDIAAIDDWGFDHVRLPFHYKDFWDDETEQLREDGFALLDSFLGWCRTYGLQVILDMHAAPGAQNAGNISDSDGEARLWTEPDPYQDWTVAIWTEIASRYADETLIIGYDLINEPVLPESVPGSALRDLYVRLTQSIREVDPNHILFIEGDQYATDFSVLSTPFDENMVYAFHKYWSSVGESSIQYLLDLRAATGVPLWLGETGENSNAWVFAVRTLAESNGIGWNWWTHKKIETISAPASARFAPGYRALVDYWSGAGPRPSETAAREALFAMARGLDLDRATLNEGVLAALFDAEFGTTARPFRDHVIPGSVHGVHYDVGDQGVAYSDQNPWAISGQPGGGNTGGVYRNDGVDIEPSTDPLGYGFNLGWIETLEWLQYTVVVEETGTYDVQFRIASASGGGMFTVSLDGEVVGSVTTGGTGGWQAWQSVWLRGIELTAGGQVLRLNVRQGGFNLNTMRFEEATGTAVDPTVHRRDELLAIFPNPSRGRLNVRVGLAAPSELSLELFDLLGRRVFATPGQFYAAGEHLIDLDLPLASGTYVLGISISDDDTSFRRVVTVRR